MRLYSLDSTPTRKSNMVTLSLEKREADRRERERDVRGNEPPGSSSRQCWFFQIFFFVCLFYISGKPFEFLLLFTRYVPASTSRRSFIFLPYSSNEEHRYCCALLRKSVLVRSLRARFANSFVRVASSLARFRETNWMDGAETFRERKKKRFWRQCPILNPMTAR